MIFIAVAVLAFLFNLLIIPGVLALSHRNKWYDSTDPRKVHTGNIPRTGGVGIFFSFLGSMAVLIFLRFFFPQFTFELTTISVLPVAIGVIILFVTGILDDFYNLRARYKLILQILAALVVVLAGYRFTYFSLPFDLGISFPLFTYAITFLWIVGVTNAINLIDGVDGLAGGVSAIAAFFWAIISLILGHTFSAFLSLALFGSVLGFLVFNKPPAKIFMGDSGSLVLGFLLAVLPLVEKESGAGSRVLLLASTLLIVPILDTLSAILRRLRKRQNIGTPDKEHMHHKLLGMGYSVSKILILIYGIGSIVGASSLIWTISQDNFNLFFLPLAWIPVIVFFLYLHRQHNAKD